MSEEAMKQIDDSLKAIDSQVKEFIDKSNAESAESGKLTTKMSEELKAINGSCEEINARVLELEQKGSGPGSPAVEKSIGDQFVESEGYKSFMGGSTQKARIELAKGGFNPHSIASVEKNTVTGAGAQVRADRVPGVIGGAFRQLRISDVIPQGNTSSNSVEFVRENVFTNLAAETAEGAAKAESSITFSLENAPVATVAHWLKITKQMAADAPAVASYINTRMAYGALVRFDNQLLTGDGVAPNIGGLLLATNSTASAAATGNPLENIRTAIGEVESADYAASAVIVNPADWTAMDLDKGTDDHFRLADPMFATNRTVWGLPVVVSNAMTADTYMVGAFDMGAQVWNRQGVVVELFEQDDTNVQSNLITVRAEMRAALTAYRPASLVRGSLTA